MQLFENNEVKLFGVEKQPQILRLRLAENRPNSAQDDSVLMPYAIAPKNSSRAGPATFASPATRRIAKRLFRHWMPPWFRPDTKSGAALRRQTTTPRPQDPQEAVFASGARPEAIRCGGPPWFTKKPLHKTQNWQVNERTAGWRAYSIARHGSTFSSFVSILIRLGDCRRIPCKMGLSLND